MFAMMLVFEKCPQKMKSTARGSLTGMSIEPDWQFCGEPKAFRPRAIERCPAAVASRLTQLTHSDPSGYDSINAW